MQQTVAPQHGAWINEATRGTMCRLLCSNDSANSVQTGDSRGHKRVIGKRVIDERNRAM